MIAFGIDPGSLHTGWGVIRCVGSRLDWIADGVIDVSGDLPLAERLEVIFRGLQLELAAQAPDHVFIESVFHHKSARSALVLGHARGVAVLAAQLARRPLGELSPAEVKLSVTGNGRAEKGQVQEMVRILLGTPTKAKRDAADALAVAIAGATRARSPIARLGKGALA